MGVNIITFNFFRGFILCDTGAAGLSSRGNALHEDQRKMMAEEGDERRVCEVTT